MQSEAGERPGNPGATKAPSNGGHRRYGRSAGGQAVDPASLGRSHRITRPPCLRDERRLRIECHRVGGVLSRPLLALALIWAVAACAGRSPTPATGTFIEEFEGFPIYHGVPGVPYERLGPVFDPVAAERGTSATKRSAVAAARRLGADAILLAPPPQDAAPSPNEATAPSGRPRGKTGNPLDKWEYAVAIRLVQ